jgi:hypothetical protein
MEEQDASVLARLAVMNSELNNMKRDVEELKSDRKNLFKWGILSLGALVMLIFSYFAKKLGL